MLSFICLRSCQEKIVAIEIIRSAFADGFSNDVHDLFGFRFSFELNFFAWIVFVAQLSANIICGCVVIRIRVFNQLHITIFESKTNSFSSWINKTRFYFWFFRQQKITNAIKMPAMMRKRPMIIWISIDKTEQRRISTFSLNLPVQYLFDRNERERKLS